jgi:RimJ/RimL family protein N-acetyltransferase
MSVEFIRGPNVYLREMTPSDLTNIHASLVDWSWFSYSVDETKNVMRPHLQNLRYLERPYKDNARYWESFVVCKVSDNSFVGFRTLKIDNKEGQIVFNAALPALRGQGLMNEAAKLLDAALFTELNCTSYTNKLDPQYITNLRAYHTLEGTELSQRSNRTLKLVKVTKDDYDTWAAANSSSIPSYNFSGGSYTPPQDR